MYDNFYSLLIHICICLYIFIYRWTGVIKEYDGGTLMECYVHPNVNYLQLGNVSYK